jgi:FemAB-related protein (PEP-CTERM system-associated)
VHMRLPLPSFPGQLWDSLSPKVRNQVRKGEKNNLQVAWGGLELLPELYEVFAVNMRDLGTPVYGRRLFRAMFRHFPGSVEICVVRLEERAIAAALLVHGKGITEVPSASSLREFNATCANMLMYWHLLERAIARGSAMFDFGRSTRDGNTFKFKKQWGAQPEPAIWQYHRRNGGKTAMRPDNPKYNRMIRLWQKLPVPVTKVIGPRIVRGIP